MSDIYATPPTDTEADEIHDPYPEQKTARHTTLAVSWQSKAIARDLAPHLLCFTYVDNLSGAADDLSIEVQDKDMLWAGDWRPEFGDTVVARLKAQGWFGYGDPQTELRCGTFAHDKISLAGKPSRVMLQCVSAPLATGLRRRKRTRAWRSVDLKQIAQDIATRAEMTLDFSGAAGPKFKSAVQNNKSDLEFLEELCKEVARTLKITESTIAIYDEATLEAGGAVGEIDRKGGYVIDYSFDADDSGRYGSCHVSCFDPRTGKTVKGQFPRDGQTIEGLDPNGQTLELVINVSDAGEANKRAEAALRNANRFATSGKLTVVGDPGLVAGVVFYLRNFGKLDGKFIVTRAEHHAVGGYTCNLSVRRCLEGY